MDIRLRETLLLRKSEFHSTCATFLCRDPCDSQDQALNLVSIQWSQSLVHEGINWKLQLTRSREVHSRIGRSPGRTPPGLGHEAAARPAGRW